MSSSPLIVIEMDKEKRISRLVDEYGKFTKQELQFCIEKISKRLGGQNTRQAITSINEGKPEIAAAISLYYYDKTYNFSLSRKKNTQVLRISLENQDSKINTLKILNVLREKKIF
jgi:tRNA 2-selenouridine synthase